VARTVLPIPVFSPFVSLAQWKKVHRRDVIVMANETPISRNAMIDERLKDVEESILYQVL
jgi:hypothetical protein